MAKRRILKKTINGVTGELFTELLFCQTFLPAVEPEKVEGVMKRIFEVQDEFLCRAQHPDGNRDRKRVKRYYRKLRADFENEVNAINQDLGSLSEEK
ncbi:hypothetical protein [Parabacteroides pacaensis]|uniref:hypothetical protein n=1 Tax=Parabacteroides pacaensis TaxID=2086575 RepID=UPI000D0E9897|nr:hypothetical protein [Parabacteroides pacaensis]